MGFEGWHVWDPGIFAWQNVMTPWVCREGHDGDSWGILVEHWLLAKIIRCYPVEIWRICRNPGAFGGLHLQALSFLIAQSVVAWVGWRPCMCKVETPPTKSQWVVHPRGRNGRRWIERSGIYPASRRSCRTEMGEKNWQELWKIFESPKLWVLILGFQLSFTRKKASCGLLGPDLWLI